MLKDKDQGLAIRTRIEAMLRKRQSKQPLNKVKQK